jgi:hypothetical protein
MTAPKTFLPRLQDRHARVPWAMASFEGTEVA